MVIQAIRQIAVLAAAPGRLIVGAQTLRTTEQVKVHVALAKPYLPAVAMKLRILVLILVIGMVGIAVPLLAHHSFTAEFDVNKPTFMDGKVTRVDWANPHVEVFIDVTDTRGRVVNWDIQVNPPHVLTGDGWTRQTLQPGMNICVEGFPEKNGKPKFGSTAVVLKATGKVFKTPPGMWAPANVTYTGSTSCTKRA